MTTSELDQCEKMVNSSSIPVDWDLFSRLIDDFRKLEGYVRHKRDCKINPGGKIMELLTGSSETHSCTCGLSELLGEPK